MSQTAKKSSNDDLNNVILSDKAFASANRSPFTPVLQRGDGNKNLKRTLSMDMLDDDPA